MRPKKVKELVSQTIEELDLPAELVTDVTSFLWYSLRKSLSSLESPAIHVDNLGTFKVRPDKLKITIARYNSFVNKSMPRTFQQHGMLHDKKLRLEKLLTFQNFIDEERARKREILDKRYEELNSGLEEQE